MRVAFSLSLVVLAVSVAACKGDPNTPEYWEKQAADTHRAQDRSRLWDDLRGSPSLTPAFVDMLHKQLGSEKKADVKASIVRVLAKLKDPRSTPALVDAIDWGANDNEGNRLNREIAQALGQIGNPAAIPPLMRMIKSKDQYVQVEAIGSLGALRAKDAVDPLIQIASDDGSDPFVIKVAIEALGNIGDSRAVPDLVKLMFKAHRRNPAGFYGESSFALYQIGRPSSEALLPVIKGEDRALNAWAKEHNVIEPALYAKSAQVLGDLHEARAENALLSKLTYKTDDSTLQLLVRMKAADALGRMRVKSAVKPIAALVSEEEPVARVEFAWALARIGSRDALPSLLKSATIGLWEARKASIETIGLLADDREAAALEKLASEEPARTKRGCEDGDPDQGCSAPDALAAKRVAFIKTQGDRMKVASTCKQDTGCWTQKLEDASPSIRERAALELGRSGAEKSVDALLKHLADPDIQARLSAIQAVDWLVDDSRAARAQAVAQKDALAQQLDKEHSQTDFVKVNEDLKRLVAKLNRTP